MSNCDGQQYIGCGNNKWKCIANGGYATPEEACENGTCAECGISVGECDSTIKPISNCIYGGMGGVDVEPAVIVVESSSSSTSIFGWIWFIFQMLNMIAAFALFVYVLFVIAPKDTGNSFLKWLMAFFLHPVYLLRYLLKNKHT